MGFSSPMRFLTTTSAFAPPCLLPRAGPPAFRWSTDGTTSLTTTEVSLLASPVPWSSQNTRGMQITTSAQKTLVSRPNYAGTQKGYRNLFDTTLLLTPTAKFSAYVNYDYGQNRIPAYSYEDEGPVLVKSTAPHWQGVAVSARGQITANAALVGRYEYFYDQGFTTGTRQHLDEFTATYEYKWLAGLLVRAEYRVDWSDKKVFNYGNDANNPPYNPTKTDQNTATIGLIAFFGPKR